MSKKISILSTNSSQERITQKRQQPMLFSAMEAEEEALGMGVLSDGTPYLNQRGLATLCGVQNAHIGTISSQWNEIRYKPRIIAIRNLLSEDGEAAPDSPHIEVPHAGKTHYCYPVGVCLAILQYYAFGAGPNCQHEAQSNFRKLAGSKLTEEIYRRVGYNPNAAENINLKEWHDRIALNHQSAPDGFFCVFNEASTLIYEMIMSGIPVGPKTVPDISIGKAWAQYWRANELHIQYGDTANFPHRYPDSHPQARSNPQTAKCYPWSALGAYREWLRGTYISGGQFSRYLQNKSAQLPEGSVPRALSKIVRREID